MESNSKDEHQSIKRKVSLSTLPNLDNVVWRSVFILLSLHVMGVCSLFHITQMKYQSWIAFFVFLYLSSLGTTAAAHRLWSHRTYKARLPLRIFLAFCNSMAIQTDIYDWSRDHRVHHKFCDTNADPYNSKRGFFFSHVGWLLVKKHPDVITKGRTIDLSDLEADRVVMFQRKYHTILSLFLGMFLPTVIPVYFWSESLQVSYLVVYVLRYLIQLHLTWCINSVAHMFGDRPYDQSISPTDNSFLAGICFGEGFHNYHHAFPWDYSTSEFGIKMNLATSFINVMWYFGLAYDLKSASKEMIESRIKRTGKIE